MSASFRKPFHAEEAYRRLAIIVALVTLSKDLLGKPLGHIWTKASLLGIYGPRQAPWAYMDEGKPPPPTLVGAGIYGRRAGAKDFIDVTCD